MLTRKTLSPGGSGDKMAALLMKHVEKEKKRLLAPSSPVKTSVRSFHTQRGQYDVHFMAPTGQFTRFTLAIKNGQNFRKIRVIIIMTTIEQNLSRFGKTEHSFLHKTVWNEKLVQTFSFDNYSQCVFEQLSLKQ